MSTVEFNDSPAPLIETDESGMRILVLAPTGRDGELISKMLERSGYDSVRCPDIKELCTCIEQGAGVVFVAEEAMATDAVTCLQDILRKQPAWSDLPVIVMTSGGKTTQYSERVAKRLEVVGNLTLLERPLRILTLLTAVQSALRARRKQYQVRRLLQDKEEAVRQRDRFLAMLGHELRNPLAAIRTAVEVTSTCIKHDPNLLDHTLIIKRQATNLARLVDDLLDVARATNGKIVLNKQLVDVRDVAQRALDAVKLAMGTQRHELLVETGAHPATVEGDPVRLEQAVSNLLSNSVKYTPAGGKIWLRVTSSNDIVAIHVRDTGEGVSPHMLPRIFEPFIQVDQDIDRSRGGLGLGLPLVKAVVEMHNGSIQAHSEGLGHGSEFVIRLPAVRPPASNGTHQPSAELHTTTSRRVLVVEDSADSRAAMRALIRLWGHQVAVAEDGLTGVQRAEEFRPEIAFIDIGLPGLDGYEVARRIRQLLGDAVCLIALTGYGQPEDRERAQRAGFDRHLVKPVEPEQIASLLTDPPGCRAS
jgi:signal transduction histidine kinase/ActR/RegA family two-component response regulator